MTLCLGIDIGTNGARIIAVDAGGTAVARAVQPMAPPRREGDRAEQDPSVWWEAVLAAFAALRSQIDLAGVRRIAVDRVLEPALLRRRCGRRRARASPVLCPRRQRMAAKRIAAVAPGRAAPVGEQSALAQLMACAML